MADGCSRRRKMISIFVAEVDIYGGGILWKIRYWKLKGFVKGLEGY